MQGSGLTPIVIVTGSGSESQLTYDQAYFRSYLWRTGVLKEKYCQTKKYDTGIFIWLQFSMKENQSRFEYRFFLIC